jgi:hypothetical protein
MPNKTHVMRQSEAAVGSGIGLNRIDGDMHRSALEFDLPAMAWTRVGALIAIERF